MTGVRWQGVGGILGAGILLATGLVLGSTQVVPEAPRRMALPPAGELVELERYLDPAEVEVPDGATGPASVVIGSSPFGGSAGVPPGGAPVGSGRGTGGGSGGPGAAGEPRWTLSAILIAGDRRVAIVNDRMARPGDRLEDGTRVETVESDHVIIRTPAGERRRLQLERQEP